MTEDIAPHGLQFKEQIESEFEKAGLSDELIPSARRATYATARKLAPVVVALDAYAYERIARLVTTYIVSLGLTRPDQVEFIPMAVGLTRDNFLILNPLSQPACPTCGSHQVRRRNDTADGLCENKWHLE